MLLLSSYGGLIMLPITQLPPGELEGINETVFAKHLGSPGGKGAAVIQMWVSGAGTHLSLCIYFR